MLIRWERCLLLPQQCWILSLNSQVKRGQDSRNANPAIHLTENTKEPEATKQWRSLTVQTEQIKQCSSAFKEVSEETTWKEHLSTVCKHILLANLYIITEKMIIYLEC